MGAVNTEIVGDPEGCQASGEWLRALSHGSLDAETLLIGVRNNSEHCWGDAVGDTFRSRLDDGRRDAGALAEDIGRIGDAQVGFADDLRTALASMREARMVAAQGGFVLTPTTIEEPRGPGAPVPANGLSPTVDEMQDHFAREERHRALVGVFNEAVGIVDRARGEENDAHETLARKVDHRKSLLEDVLTDSRFLLLATIALNAGVGIPASTYGQAAAWTAVGQHYDDLAARLNGTFTDPNLTREERGNARLQILINQSRSQNAHRIAQQLQNSRLLVGLQNSAFGRRTLSFLGRSAEDALDGTSVRTPAALRPVLGGVTRGNVLLAGAGVAMDMAAGEPVEQAVISNGAGMVVGGTFTAVGLAFATTGPQGAAVVAVGIGLSIGANFLVDRIMSDD